MLKRRAPKPPAATPDLPRAGVIAEPDFVSEGAESYCRHCGIVKEASAKFFATHHRECVTPRKLERDEEL